MSRRRKPGALVAVATVGLIAAGAGTAAATDPSGTSTGPSSSQPPYVIPVGDGVSTKSLLTVGDSVGGYRMVGIPDGLGALRNGRSIELFMNHELARDKGVVRRHGQTGAFVSRFSINRRTLRVSNGYDLIDPGVSFWNYPTQTYGPAPSAAGPNPRDAADPGAAFLAQTAAFNRFCSGTLSDRGQFYNKRSGRGYDGQLYFGNEEGGDESRSFAITTSGITEQLPRLGLFSWENTKPAYNKTDRTLVQGQEDNASGQIWTYVGTKRSKGTAAAQAGLTNGALNVIDAVDESVTNDAEFRAKYGKGKAAEVDLSQVDWDQSGAAQNREAAADGLSLNRIEDGSWDPQNPNDYYFHTTEGGDKTPTPGTTSARDGGGLWKLSYEDIENPELGATLTLLLDGSEAPYLNKPDNMTIDQNGNLLIQEDPGNNPHVSRIVAYRIADGALGVLARFDRRLFAPKTETDPKAEDAKLTTDEESSGIIDAAGLLGEGWFLFDAQVHKTNPDPELVEEGQLLAMKVKDFADVYDDDDNPVEEDEVPAK